MTVRKKRGTPPRNPQDPRRYATAERKREGERINAVAALQRAARRCGKHLGSGCVPGLIEILEAELGGGLG
jgi:hypothetical protein